MRQVEIPSFSAVLYARRMALIRCPDCSKEVSDAAPKCPGCGSPMTAAPAPARVLSPVVRRPTNRTLQQDRSVVWTVGGAVAFVIATSAIEWCRNPH
jgi:hypothetical protein